MTQTIYYGGPILPMDRPGYLPALLVEDGCIRACDTPDQLFSAAPQARRVDLEGRALLPAFLDPHSHFSACANALLQCSVAQASDFSQLQQCIRDYITANCIPAGNWIMARDLDPDLLAEHQVPDRTVLDQAAPEHPVILQHKSGHVGVLNSLALQRMGIGPDTPDPEGGRIHRQDGVPTGYLEENAFIGLLERLPPPDPGQLMAAFQKVQNLYASYGIATVQEGMMVPSMIPLYQGLCSQKKLWLDVVGYPALAEAEAIYAAFPGHDRRYQDHFKLGGYKIFLDGSPQSRTAWTRTPYLGSTDCGYPVLSDRQVDEAVTTALTHRRQLLAHCNGDGAAEQYLQALERAGNTEAIRPVMVHAQLIGLDQLPRLKKLGCIPSFFVAHVYHWGDAHIRNLGQERASHISPAADAGKLGLPYTFHQDAPVIPPDMMETVWCAVNRVTRDGADLKDGEAVPVWDALRAVTANSAYQYFEEDTKGTLTPGKRADLVILDQDPLTVPPERLREIRVDETIKDGETVYRR